MSIVSRRGPSPELGVLSSDTCSFLNCYDSWTSHLCFFVKFLRPRGSQNDNNDYCTLELWGSDGGMCRRARWEGYIPMQRQCSLLCHLEIFVSDLYSWQGSVVRTRISNKIEVQTRGKFQWKIRNWYWLFTSWTMRTEGPYKIFKGKDPIFVMVKLVNRWVAI